MTTAIDLDSLQLAKGSHDSCEDGMCLFEAYNMLAHAEHTAGAAARNRLQPTVDILQASALDLYRSMIRPALEGVQR